MTLSEVLSLIGTLGAIADTDVDCFPLGKCITNATISRKRDDAGGTILTLKVLTAKLTPFDLLGGSNKTAGVILLWDIAAIEAAADNARTK